MNILYLETDVAAAKQLHAHLLELRPEHWDLVHVRTYEDATRRLKDHAFDLILMGLCDRGGDVCFQLHSLAPMTPIVGMGGPEPEASMVRFIESGGEDYCCDSLPLDLLIRRLWLNVERFRSRQSQRPTLLQHVTSSIDAVESTRTVNAVAPKTIHLPSKIKVLHLDDCHETQSRVRQQLSTERFNVIAANKYEEAVRLLQDSAFDVVLLDCLLSNGAPPNLVDQIGRHCETEERIVLTRYDEEAAAVQMIRNGASDYLAKTELPRVDLANVICTAIARAQRDSLHAVTPTEDRRNDDRGSVDRREFTRYSLDRPVHIVPLLPRNLPDLARRIDGICQDVSAGGLSLEIENQETLPARKLIVGIEAVDGNYYYVTAEVRGMELLPGRLRLSCRYVEADQDLLCERNLLPSLDLSSCRLHPALPPEVLHAWEKIGVMQRYIVDRALLCPECRGVPTFRRGCASCGSAQVMTSRLIHHFACAHVGNVVEFEGDGELVCPKCRARGMIAGTDFEYLNGPHRCLQCSLVGHGAGNGGPMFELPSSISTKACPRRGFDWISCSSIGSTGSRRFGLTNSSC